MKKYHVLIPIEIEVMAVDCADAWNKAIARIDEVGVQVRPAQGYEVASDDDDEQATQAPPDSAA